MLIVLAIAGSILASPLASPSAAAQRAAVPTSSSIAVFIGNADGSLMANLASADGKTMQADAMAGRPPERSAYPPVHGRSAMTRTVSVGLGWYIYVYLNASNINWLRGMTYTAATATLCGILVATVAGGVACAVAASIVYQVFYRPTSFPSGYCLEFKFDYGASLVGIKAVKRSC